MTPKKIARQKIEAKLAAAGWGVQTGAESDFLTGLTATHATVACFRSIAAETLAVDELDATPSA